jgi:hypothetical protein
MWQKLACGAKIEPGESEAAVAKELSLVEFLAPARFSRGSKRRPEI